MSDRITAREAIEQLRNHPETYRTPESLRALAAQVDANSAGRVTVLYSGPVTNHVSSGQIVNAMVRAGEDVRIIDNSQAAAFLKSRDFNDAVARTFEVPLRPLMDGTYRGPATNWLYHPTQGPWADASARFVDATQGEVRTITSGADPGRVFGATELPRALNNPGITHIDGIPRQALVDLQARHGPQAPFEAVVARSHAATGALRIDADDFALPVIRARCAHRTVAARHQGKPRRPHSGHPQRGGQRRACDRTERQSQAIIAQNASNTPAGLRFDGI